jgi:periplasmic protein CpxP/Spy
MSNKRKILIGAVAAAALAASSMVVYAQPAGPGAGFRDCPQGSCPDARGFGPGAGRGGMGHGAHHGGMGHGKWSNPAARVEGYLAALKVELGITPDQNNAWQAFTSKAKAQAEAMPARRAQMYAHMSATNQSAPERLAQRTELAKQRLASMESMTAAVKDLYAALTPEQKAIADQHMARGPMGGARHGHGFRG